MNHQLVLLVISTILMAGCCREPHVDPSLPTESLGWLRQLEKGVFIEGKFVLHKGEAVNNGKVEIKVVDIIPGDACTEAGTYLRNPSAKIQLVRLSDYHVLCDGRFYEGGGEVLPEPNCVAGAGFTGVYVRSMNLKDGWVFFQLTGLEPKTSLPSK